MSTEKTEQSWVVVDLDGTLCDTSHRQHLAQAREWDQFNSLCCHDKPVKPIADLVGALAKSYSVLLLTARDETYEKMTYDWLIKHRIFSFDALLMRRKGDYRPDFEVKIEALEAMFGQDKEAVLKSVAFCIEDRNKVVEAMRNYGLTVLQVCEGSY